MSMRYHILGVPVDELDAPAAEKLLTTFLHSNTFHTIFTPNPEMVVLAQRDDRFKSVLKRGDVLTVDGKGLEWAIQFLYGKKVARLTGNDWVELVGKLSEHQNISVFFLGGGPQVGEWAAQKFQARFPRIHIAGTFSNLKVEKNGKTENLEFRKKIEDTKPDIIFVSFGHGKQEKFIFEHISKFPSIKVALAIGGAIDFLAGTKHRAPQWMQKYGLEWAWRLLQEPSRFKRIIQAVIVFPSYIFYTKLFSKDYVR